MSLRDSISNILRDFFFISIASPLSKVPRRAQYIHQSEDAANQRWQIQCVRAHIHDTAAFNMRAGTLDLETESISLLWNLIFILGRGVQVTSQWLFLSGGELISHELDIYWKNGTQSR